MIVVTLVRVVVSVMTVTVLLKQSWLLEQILNPIPLSVSLSGRWKDGKMETDRKKLVSEKYLWTYCTTILQELTHFHIDQVLDKRDKLKTLNYVHTAIEMWRKEHSRAIMNAVNEGFANVAIGELNFFYGYSLLSKLIETYSVLPLISCSSNIKPALTLTHHRANPSEVKDLT